MQKSANKEISYLISQQVEAMERYSASTEYLETVTCLFDFQEIKEFPMKRQKPVTDLQESG